SMLRGCNDGQALAWDVALDVWHCSSAGTGTITAVGDVVGGQAFTQAGGQGTSLWFNDSVFTGKLTIGTLSTDRTYTLPNETGTICLQGSSSCGFSSGTNYWQLNGNLLSPINSTYDFAIGGSATSSA